MLYRSIKNFSYIDSCSYPPKNSITELEKLKLKFKKNGCKRAIINIKDYDKKKFFEFQNYFEKTKFFYPVYHLQKKQNIQKQFQFLKKENIKLIKIHPRFLCKDLNKNFNFFKKIFLSSDKFRINIMFCTFDSFVEKSLHYNNLNLISKLVNLTKNIKIILMHSGGTNILSYYERFRFVDKVILDLSYTAQHFSKTSLMKDMVFLIDNFDKRLIIGSDYPSKSLKNLNFFINIVSKKISQNKVKNVLRININKLLNEISK